jgi:hypothetical protein
MLRRPRSPSAAFSGNNNLIRDNSGGIGGANGNISGNPQLGTLGDYSGTFVLPDGAHVKVVPLQPGSPAIGAGNGTTCTASTSATPPGAGGIDERGATRTLTACDIGAYQNVPAVTGISPAAGGTGGGGSAALSGIGFGTTVSTHVLLNGAAIPAANVTSVTPTTVTYQAPAHGVGTVTVTVTVSGTAGLGSVSYQYAVINAPPSAKPSGGTSGSSPVSLPGSRPVGSSQGVPSSLPPSR